MDELDEDSELQQAMWCLAGCERFRKYHLQAILLSLGGSAGEKAEAVLGFAQLAGNLVSWAMLCARMVCCRASQELRM